VVDTSVVVKWFHTTNEAEVVEARALLAAHRDEALTAHLPELLAYEIGNVMIRSLGFTASTAADQIDDLLVMCGPFLQPAPAWYRIGAELAEQHRLSFYDAMFVATARALDCPLVSADKKLLAAGLAEAPSGYTRRIGLTD
jgi:predicted nucleic acid-binding protein